MFAYVASAVFGPPEAGRDPPATGITVHRVDSETGRLHPVQQLLGANPMYFAISQSRQILYAVSRSGEAGNDADDGLTSFSIDPASGRLTELARIPIDGYPAYLSLDRDENFALFVSTFSGMVATVAVLADGRFGEVKEYPMPGRSLLDQGLGEGSIGKVRWPYGTTPFPHSIRMSPDNRFAFVADVGLNRVHVFRFDPATGVLTPNDPPSIESVPIRNAWNREQNPVWDNPSGAGPRHFEFHLNGRWLYVVHEAGSVITVLDYDADAGRLQLSQEIPTLPVGFTGSSSPADIHVHPNGRFLYATNRRHDSIVSYTIDPQNGRLTLLEFTPAGGKNPRSFEFTPEGDLMLLSVTSSDAILVFSVDVETGRLTPNGIANTVPTPVHAILHTP